jgi:hypothetical protein
MMIGYLNVKGIAIDEPETDAPLVKVSILILY